MVKQLYACGSVAIQTETETELTCDTERNTEAGYTDPKTTVVKFRKGLDPQIQNTIATMAYGCPSDSSLENWYEAARTVDQNRAANEAFKTAY